VSEVSEAELGEWEQGAEAEELGAGGGGELPLPPPPPDFMASAGEGWGEGCAFICSFFLSFTPARLLFLCNSLGAHHIVLGKAWAEGSGELATCRHRADSGQETDYS